MGQRVADVIEKGEKEEGSSCVSRPRLCIRPNFSPKTHPGETQGRIETAVSSRKAGAAPRPLDTFQKGFTDDS